MKNLNCQYSRIRDTQESAPEYRKIWWWEEKKLPSQTDKQLKKGQKDRRLKMGLWCVCFGLKKPLRVERQSPVDSPVELEGTRVFLWWTVLELRYWK